MFKHHKANTLGDGTQKLVIKPGGPLIKNLCNYNPPFSLSQEENDKAAVQRNATWRNGKVYNKGGQIPREARNITNRMENGTVDLLGNQAIRTRFTTFCIYLSGTAPAVL